MQPISFHPIIKQIRWGGRRLGTVLNKPIGSSTDYAESWEICDHVNAQSLVCSGQFQGLRLHDLVLQHQAEIFGEGSQKTQFPLLIKYLDCNDRLSVQVHPNDEQAQKFSSEENGKTEAWVVMQADPGSVIYAGFREQVDREQVAQAIENGTLESLLNRITPQAGECYFIPAGTVHALGEGVLIAEVQQTSDLTFRLYDWGRVDRDGKPRPLHIEESLACLNYDQGPISAVEPKKLDENESTLVELLVPSDYFAIKRYSLTGPETLPALPVCRILMGISGSGEWEDFSSSHPFEMGQTWLVPASSSDLHLRPTSQTTWQILVIEIP